ncbi:MAG: hypothetical protein LC791_05200 [Acidobacteria bacterium]|nr:hypothetical protein [Acidobacteriota bacterium]
MKPSFSWLVGLVLCAATTQAQQPPPDPTADLRPAEVQRLFDAYMVMQAQEALALSEDQYVRFLPRLKALQDTRRRAQRERTQIINELQRLTNPRQPGTAGESVLKERLDALQETESRGAAELRKAYNALGEILDLRQQARFRVFEEQMERRKLELVLRARHNNRLERRQQF